jgi:uncharacterized membrane protein YqjE
MATRNRIEIDRHSTRGDGRPLVDNEPPIRDLLKQLATQGTDLVRGEVALAKLELRDMARDMAFASAKVAGALVLVLAGALALLAAAIIGLGNLLNGQYALSALIISVVVLVIGGILARAGIAGLRNPPRPDQTVASLKRDRAWAGREAREFRDEIRS